MLIDSLDHAENIDTNCGILYILKFKILNLLERCQTASEAVSLQCFDILTPNFVCAIVTSH